jgi:OmpA-OmpF porin, OOP family
VRGIKLLVILCSVACHAIAQTDSALARDASGKTLKRLGKNALRQNDPASAVTFLEAYSRYRPGDPKGQYLLAKAYAEVRDYERAQKYYLKAYRTNKAKVPDALYHHAQMQKSNGKYDSARIAFQKFRKEYKGSDRSLKRQAAKEIVICDSIGKFYLRKKNLVIQWLDTTVNKLNAEGAAIALDDSTLLYTSLRTDSKLYVEEGDTVNIPRQKLYLAKRTRNGQWKFAGEFPINDPRYHTGNPALSPDRKRLYFTRCRENLMDEIKCAIYVVERKGAEWGDPQKLPVPVNHKRYTCTMPAIAADPVKGNEIIYFVSNRKKGKGGLDIWFTTYEKKMRRYKVPKNAGSKVNTAGDEVSPFFDHETRTLYFSSDGQGGLGGFDVYRTIGDGKRVSAVDNVGLPVNSGADEIYYSISTNRKEGFFASNRKTERVTKNRTCCDDLFSFNDPEYVQVTLKGIVLDRTDASLPVSDAKVEVYIRESGGDRVLLRSTTTDKAGRYDVKLETSQDYEVVIRKKEFLSGVDSVSTRGIDYAAEITREMKVTRKPKEAVTIPNFQYEFGRSDLTADSKAALDKLLVSMMVANPEIVVEIQAHTDSKGNDAYNQKLSQKRADNIVNYVISKGITPERIKGIGYGEAKPIAPNEHPDGSDNPEGRAKNRRTEFKIIGEVAVED